MEKESENSYEFSLMNMENGTKESWIGIFAIANNGPNGHHYNDDENVRKTQSSREIRQTASQ